MLELFYFMYTGFLFLTLPCVFSDYGVTPQEDDAQSEHSDEDHDASDEQNISQSRLGGLMALLWTNHKHKLEHDYAIMGWALSVMPEVYKDARERLTGKHWDAIERVARKLFKYHYTNKFPDLKGKLEDEIVDLFWDELKAFCNKTVPFE